MYISTYDLVYNMVDILKDIGRIWTRLFDHKVFLNGEIQFTLREYEQKRSDKEVEHLFSLLEQIADLKVAQINRLEESVALTLPHTETKAREGLIICDSIAELEQAYAQDSSIELSRNNIKLIWEQFVDNMSTQCAQVDNTFQEQEKELHKLYDELRDKLDIPAFLAISASK